MSDSSSIGSKSRCAAPAALAAMTTKCYDMLPSMEIEFHRLPSFSLPLSCPNLPVSNWQLHTGRPLEQLPSFRCCNNRRNSRGNTAAPKMPATEAGREAGEEDAYYYQRLFHLQLYSSDTFAPRELVSAHLRKL